MKIINLFYFIIFLLLRKFSSRLTEIIATNQVKTFCDNGLYIIDIKVNFSSPLEEYYSFNLNIESPKFMIFKCFISFQNSAIHCVANLNSNKIKVERTETIKMPNEFPIIKGLIWDYASFVKYIYERELILDYNCKQKNLENLLNIQINNEKDLIFNISSIYNNKCTYAKNVEENKYFFNMKLQYLNGFLNDNLDNFNINNYIPLKYLEFLQDIWVPLEIGDNNNNFTKNNDFPFAFCNIKQTIIISSVNIKKLANEGLDFECYIPIQEEQLIMGIIKIEPFFDNLFIRIKEDISLNSNIIEANLYFNINRTIEQKNIIKNNDILTSSNELNFNENKNLRRNDEISNNHIEITNNNEIQNNSNLIIDNENSTEIIINNNETQNINSSIINLDNEAKIEIEKNNTSNESIGYNPDSTFNENKSFNSDSIINENISYNSDSTINENIIFTTVNYFIIGDEINKIYCPDKPIFTIEKAKYIQLKSSGEKNYTILIKGKLSSRYQLENSNSNYYELNKTKEEILFNLQVIDNLAENEDNQKTLVNCIIPKDTSLFSKNNIIIYCYGNKISEESMKNNDTDITLNWGIEINRLHEKIIIRWPKIKKKIKHMYSYTINAFSLMQKNYGCFNNEFFFYIYIYTLNNQPDISFDIQMGNPQKPKAHCKIYDSSLLKCFYPLDKERIIKGTKISLPTNITYDINDSKGNKVLFIVDEYYYDYEDFHLIVKETCGDYVFVGALRNAGLSYFMILMGIISIATFITIVFICFIFYVKYKIKNRSKKGKYFAYVSEGDNSGIKGKVLKSSKKKLKV